MGGNAEIKPSSVVRFSSSYPEISRFELYIPNGWTGSYRDFLAEIPQEERYWIVDERNLFERK